MDVLVYLQKKKNQIVELILIIFKTLLLGIYSDFKVNC